MKKTLIYAALIFGGIAVSCQTQNSETQGVSAVPADHITIATIDTDSLFAHYDMVADVMKELEDVDRRLSGDLQRQARNLQNDYENYLKIGATLTSSEQRSREERLQKRQEELQQLEQRYMQQMMETRARKNREVEDEIFSFVEKYNKANGNFTIILSKARSSGTLYSLPSMDITEPVIAAMNAEYSTNRKGRNQSRDGKE